MTAVGCRPGKRGANFCVTQLLLASRPPRWHPPRDTRTYCDSATATRREREEWRGRVARPPRGMEMDSFPSHLASAIKRHPPHPPFLIPRALLAVPCCLRFQCCGCRCSRGRLRGTERCGLALVVRLGRGSAAPRR